MPNPRRKALGERQPHSPTADLKPKNNGGRREASSGASADKENWAPKKHPVREDACEKTSDAHCKLTVNCKPENGSNVENYKLTDFELGHLLGVGKYGHVYAATDHVLQKSVALKLVNLGCSVEKHSLIKQLEREIEIQGNIRHKNIIQLFGFIAHNDLVVIVLELARHGSLFDHLQKDGAMSEEIVARHIRAVAEALRHLHQHGVLHRDIKPENVLIGDSGVAKLADFGWSILRPNGRCNTLCGTVDYLAPEMVKGQGYDAQVDVWSLGVLCYELLYGGPPFAGNNFVETSKRIKAAKYTFPQEPTVSTTAKNFIKAILVTDPRKRLKLKDLLEHPFLEAPV